MPALGRRGTTEARSSPFCLPRRACSASGVLRPGPGPASGPAFGDAVAESAVDRRGARFTYLGYAIDPAAGAVTCNYGLDVHEFTERVCVTDADPRLPRPVENPPEDAVRGRGLYLVARLATRWRAEPLGDTTGKTVWFELGHIPEAAHA